MPERPRREPLGPAFVAAAFMGAVMSKIDDVLMPGSTDRPDCICGTEMALTKVRPIEPQGTEAREYQCPACGHQLTLMVWSEISAQPSEQLPVVEASN